MKRFIPILFALLIPATMFAQARKVDENALLKNLGLNDTQVSQVLALQKSTRETTHADLTHIRLIKAQIDEALLAANPDEQAINALIDKKGLLRTDIEKNRLSARLQLLKIVGPDDFSKIAMFMRERRQRRFQEWRDEGRFDRQGFMPEGGAPAIQ